MECDSFRNPSIWNTVLSLVLTVGVFGSYIPQHLRVVRLRSSEGISPWFLLLGVCSGVCAVGNIWILGGPVYHCCKVIGFGDCVAGTLGIAQITFATAGASLVLILVLIFAKDQPLESPEEFQQMRLVGKLSLIVSASILFVSLYTYFNLPRQVHLVADFLGVSAAIFATIQYFPQIYTTYSLGHVGTLSIPMMCIQTPGGYLWSLTLALRQGTSWSSWLPYFTSAVLQNVLLIMAIFFEVRNARERSKHASNETAARQSRETDPLLGHS